MMMERGWMILNDEGWMDRCRGEGWMRRDGWMDVEGKDG